MSSFPAIPGWYEGKNGFCLGPLDFQSVDIDAKLYFESASLVADEKSEFDWTGDG